MTGDAEPERVGGRVAIYPRGKKRTFIADFWQDGVHRKVSLKTAQDFFEMPGATLRLIKYPPRRRSTARSSSTSAT